MSRIYRLVALALFAGILSGCADARLRNADQVAMGDFSLGHNVVVVNSPEIGPFSRTATDDEWKEVLTAAIERRFGGYDGEKLYHIGVKIDAYALAVAGVPVVFAPQSALVVTANFWDDATQTKLSGDGKGMTILEGVDERTLISSGLLQTKQQQMEKLADLAALEIQKWILENPEWIGLPENETDAQEDAQSDN